jgi:hypothetical protein
VEERRVRSSTVTAVFGSGTKQESSSRAVFIVGDEKMDLAVLRVSDLKDAPAPIAMDKSPEPHETMPVYVLGFPFGRALSFSKGNPAITIGKGTVSSLRLNDAGELNYVQIDGALNPGNSGGPVVDEKGQLVAIAVAIVKEGRGIAMAIPAQQLTRLLKGRSGTPQVSIAQRNKESVILTVQMRLFDPLAQIRAATFHYATVDGKDKARVSALPEAKQVKLKIEGQLAVGQFALPANRKADMPLTFQGEIIDGDGKAILTRVQGGTLKASSASTTGRPPQPAPKPKPLGGEELTATLAELKSDSGPERRVALRRLLRVEPDKERGAGVVAAVKPLLSDSEPATRLVAVQVYFIWAGKDALPVCTDLLKSDDSVRVRATLMNGLAHLGGAEAAPAIAACLPKEEDRPAATKALTAIGPEAEKAVIPLLGHANFRVRVEACKILEKIGTPDSLAALKKASRGLPRIGVANVERAAEEAISAITARGKK